VLARQVVRSSPTCWPLDNSASKLRQSASAIRFSARPGRSPKLAPSAFRVGAPNRPLSVTATALPSGVDEWEPTHRAEPETALGGMSSSAAAAHLVVCQKYDFPSGYGGRRANFTVLSPPLLSRTVRTVSSSKTLEASACQISPGIAQGIFDVYATRSFASRSVWRIHWRSRPTPPTANPTPGKRRVASRYLCGPKFALAPSTFHTVFS